MSEKEMKKAFDDFKDEKFMDADETIRKVVKDKVNTHLKTKLKLDKDPLDIEKDDKGDDDE